MRDLLEGLDDQQRLVATSLDAPVCVLAGAGTGKTRSITHRIAYGVSQGVYQPDQVLALTFTTKAAAEMGHRLVDLGVSGVATRTFHSAALRQLTHFWPELTGGRLPDIVASKASLITGALQAMKIDVSQALVRDLAGDIEWRKVNGLTVAQYRQARAARGGLPGGMSIDVVAQIHERYEQIKDEQERIDFEDVLLATSGMLEAHPRVLEQVRAQYRVFIVDEYQDVSPLQQRLLDQWVGEREDIVVVGDASQTIYSFAGATSSYLLDFAERYPGAHVVTLETNYRSGGEIVRAANTVMQGRPGAIWLTAASAGASPLRRHVAADDQAEAGWVVQVIQEWQDQGRSLADAAVLVRFGAQSLPIESALRDAGIATMVQGRQGFFGEPHVRRAVMEIRGAAVAGVSGELVDVVADILFGIGLTPEPPAGPGAERSKWEDLNAVLDLAHACASMTLAEFSANLASRMDSGDAPGRGQVTLSSVHAAKGQEWPLVILIGLAEGLFPISYATDDEALEEERRLFYVGLTRAREQLALSVAERSRPGQAPREVSRFLRELG